MPEAPNAASTPGHKLWRCAETKEEPSVGGSLPPLHAFLHLGGMPDRHFETLQRLIRQANQASSRKPDSIRLLAEMIRLVTADGADPYLVIGVLVEGAVHTIDKHIPPARQAETIDQLRLLLVERLKARGLV
jgi:hypothetical protein